MSQDMKLIMESWHGFVSEEQATLSAEQIEQLKQFAKEVVIVAQAIEDTERSNEGKASMRRRQKADRKQRTKEIKKRAGLSGVKFKDFTPAHRQLYDIAKQELSDDEEANQFQTLVNIQNGDLLNIPIIKDIVDARGGTFRKMITGLASAASGNIACAEQNALTLNCLLGIISAEATG